MTAFHVQDHRLTPACFVHSPNQSERPDGSTVDLLVIHSISLPPGRYGTGCIDQLFCNQLDPAADPYFAGIAGLRVSAHLLIDRQGQVTQYVPFDCKAWHAGESQYRGRRQCNDFSIGIELEGTDDSPFADIQYVRLTAVIQALWSAYPELPTDAIVGHSDIAPGRKTDPGPHFDWQRLRVALSSPLKEAVPT